jgi:density-regulated protein DRP1
LYHLVNKKKTTEETAKMKQQDQPVIITTSTRRKRKHVTTITGLEYYGVNHKEASKFFAKKLSAGASVVKKPVVSLEIQGDVHYEVMDLLVSQFNIPKGVIKYVEEKKKGAAATSAGRAESDSEEEEEDDEDE